MAGYDLIVGDPSCSRGMFKTINAVQIHVSLDEIEPKIWRRLVLPSAWNLGQLHIAAQAAFNWWNYHLHEFQIGGLRYGDVELLTQDADEDDPRVFDGSPPRLRAGSRVQLRL
ncbi:MULTISPECIES: plasmid pRiA4b ORF-3 family protein [Mesorhizobium]|uniref:plasmid pRiA4b ORF-3 family protein n=1 Tax=Mesorhizobium TaxID=68287 RepID=UPI00313B6E83